MSEQSYILSRESRRLPYAIEKKQVARLKGAFWDIFMLARLAKSVSERFSNDLTRSHEHELVS